MNQFSERLKKLRVERKVTQRQLGKHLDFGATAIVNYESGRNEPAIDTLIKLAEYFGVSVGYLIGSEKDAVQKSRLTQQQRELLAAFSQLSQMQRESLLDFLKTLQPEKKQGKSEKNSQKGIDKFIQYDIIQSNTKE